MAHKNGERIIHHSRPEVFETGTRSEYWVADDPDQPITVLPRSDIISRGSIIDIGYNVPILGEGHFVAEVTKRVPNELVLIEGRATIGKMAVQFGLEDYKENTTLAKFGIALVFPRLQRPLCEPVAKGILEKFMDPYANQMAAGISMGIIQKQIIS